MAEDQVRGPSYIVTSDVHLVHPVSDRKQELDAELLVCHVDIGDYLTTWRGRHSGGFNQRSIHNMTETAVTVPALRLFPVTNSNFYFLFSIMSTTLLLSANKDTYPGSLFSSLCRGLSEVLSHIKGMLKLRVIKLQQHGTQLEVLFFCHRPRRWNCSMGSPLDVSLFL